jgi:hypothetical protein
MIFDVPSLSSWQLERNKEIKQLQHNLFHAQETAPPPFSWLGVSWQQSSIQDEAL